MTPSAPRKPFILLAAALAVLFPASTLFAAPPASESAPRLEPPTVAASGSQRSVVAVPSFGRYALWAESERGVAVQLVDRMAGPGPVVGAAGGENGRLDLFLDRGDYLLRTFGSGDAGDVDAGDHATLRAEPFVELQPDPVRITNLKLVRSELGDLEQRSWWLQLDSRTRVVFEAAGRHLEDLRLWQGGSWLVDAPPSFETIEPRQGRPLRLARLSTRLEPGLYRLTAYGGAGVAWTEDDGTRPLFLRSGVAKVSEAARKRLEISPFGFDRFLVPGGANYFRLEAPAGVSLDGDESISLERAFWQPEAPFAGAEQRAEIVKENRFPVAEIETWTGENETRWHVLTVRGRAGQAVVLQHFRSVDFYSFKKPGRFLISTVSSGTPGDAIDASALLVRNERTREEPLEVMESKAVVLRGGLEWRRRFNLPEAATLHLRVVETGRYAIRGGGDADMRLRLEPFFAPGTEPEGYAPPPFRDDGDVWELEKGYYLLTLEPRRAGILTLAIRDDDGSSAGTASAQAPGPAPPHQSIAFFGEVDLEDAAYRVFINRRPEVRSGLILRRLPIDLESSLPLVADSTEALSISGRARQAGVLTATAEDGTRLEVSVDGGPWRREARVEGEFSVSVRPPAELDLPAAYDLAVLPDARSPEVPLPSMPSEAMELPEFDVLAAGSPIRFGMDRRASRTFLLRSERAALYRLESTGLLDTEGTLRTRVLPDLERSAAGGSGRNFAVQRYLGPGDYQLTVRTRGESRGRLGVRLAEAPVTSGGELREGLPVRSWLDAGEARGYRFEIAEAGRFRLRSFGLQGDFRIRLEDAEGWPLIEPATAGDVTVELEAGSYRLIVLPQEVRARQVTRLERLEEPVERDGHGPFELPLGETAHHRWLEPAEGGERLPDRWRFELPARADVSITLGQGMEADLLSIGQDTRPIDTVPAERGLRRELGRGVYELHARSARRDNRVDYEVRVETRQLLAGQRRELPSPRDVFIRVGEAALVELSSFGRTDVRARLFDASSSEGDGSGGDVSGKHGELLAISDDRPGDWNFRLARRLEPGTYRLEVEAVAESGPTVVEMQLPSVKLEASWALAESAQERRVEPGSGSVRLPITPPPSADLLLASFDSPEHVRVIVERNGRPLLEKEGRRGELWLPLPADSLSPEARGELALRVDSLDQGGNAVRLEAAAIAAKRASEAGAARLVLRPVPALDGRGVVAVELERGGCFRVAGSGDGAARVEVAAASTETSGVPAPLRGVASAGEVLWLAAPRDARLRLERHRIEAGGEPTRLHIPPGGEALCDIAAQGPSALRAAGLGGAVSATVGREYGDQALEGTTALLLLDGPGDGPGTLRLRSGDGAELEVDVELRQVGDLASEKVAAPWGRFESAVEAALDIELPPGPKALRLALSRGLAARLGDGSSAGPTFWAQGSGRDIRVETGATLLRVLCVDGAGGRVAVESAPAKPSPPLRHMKSFERRLPGSGRIVTSIAAAEESSFLRVLGAEATVLFRDGSIRRGDSLGLSSSPGRLVLDYGGRGSRSGDLVMAWIEKDGEAGFGAGFGAEAGVSPRLVEPPAQLEASGGAAAYAVDLEEPAVLSLRGTAPALSIVERSDGSRRHAVHADFLRLDVALDAGRSRVELRGLAGESLRGELIFRLAPIESLGEGVGPQVLLAGGESRFFAVDVESAGALGFGVDAESDVVSARLLDDSGAEIGRGVAQMHELEAGRYLFALSLPAESPPVRLRPAVVGLEPPDTGPPPEVRERYLELAGGER